MAHYPDLQNARVLITGASRGIGTGMARAFAAQGCQVLLHYNQSTEQVQQLAEELAPCCPGVDILHCDFRDTSSLAGFAEAALARYDGLDVLVNMLASSPNWEALEMRPERLR